MIEKGELIVDGYVHEVMKKARERITLYVRVKADTDRAAALLETHPDVDRVSVDKTGTIEVSLLPSVEDYTPLSELLFSEGFRLTLFREEEVNLETAFMELTKGVQQ